MSKKNILIINSNSVPPPLYCLFEELVSADYKLICLFGSADFLNNKKSDQTRVKQKSFFQKNNNSITSPFLFFATLPLLWLFFFFALFHNKKKKRAESVICFYLKEKIIITPIAGLLKLRIIWVELPGDIDKNIKSVLGIYRILSKRVKVAALLELTCDQLKEININQENIKLINLGIKPENYGLQDNLFSRLAENDHKKPRNRFFTLGTVMDSTGTQNLETLFQAVKKCLSVIPNLQLIVIGDSQGRKSMQWLAKKLEIDGLIWFVGEQKHLKKWLDSFNIFVITNDVLKLIDINVALRALASRLPVIGPANIGLEGIITDQRTGIIVKANDSEAMARAIIRLQRDKRLCLNLGESARNTVDKNFSLDIMVKRFKKLINGQGI